MFSSLTGIIVLHLWQEELESVFFYPSFEKSIFLFLVVFPAFGLSTLGGLNSFESFLAIFVGYVSDIYPPLRTTPFYIPGELLLPCEILLLCFES
jgi:hypothetical protein